MCVCVEGVCDRMFTKAFGDVMFNQRLGCEVNEPCKT